MTDLDTGIHLQINRLRILLDSCPFFTLINREKQSISSLLDQLDSGFEQAGRPLRMVLTGGTGVGKSSLLNAIAGQSIAPAGHLRPTTRTFTAYCHEADEDPWIQAMLDVTVVRHTRDTLKNKSIIDAPDADSSIIDHRRALIKSLELADLAVVVVTAEKYVSKDILDLLGQFHKKCHFVFVFNKIDLYPDAELIKDFRQWLQRHGFGDYPLFSISTEKKQDIPLNESGDGGVQNQIQEFIGFLETELTLARVKEIKRLNLVNRTLLLVDYLRSLLPEHYMMVVARWVEACENEADSLVTSWMQMVSALFLAPIQYIPMFTMTKARGFRGIFGLLSNLIYLMIRSTRWRKSFPEDLLDTGSIHQDLMPHDGDRLKRDMEQLVETCRAIGSRNGMVLDSIDPDMELPSAFRDIADPRRWIQTIVKDRVNHHFNLSCRPAGVFFSFILNIPAWAWIGFWAYRLVDPVFRGLTIPWDAVPGAAIVLVAFLAFEWAVVNRFLSLWSKRRVRRFISDVTGDIRTSMTDGFQKSIDRWVEPLQECTRTIDRTLEELSSMSELVVEDDE